MKAMVLDIGGTAIKSAVCEDGALSDIREYATEALLGGSHVSERAAAIIADYGGRYVFDRIGISTTGQVDPREGFIIYANQNMPGYTGIRLKEMMERKFGVPTEVENDVNAAAIGEARFGAGRGEKDFVCLTYGTGVGGAIVSGGEIYYGSSFSAGEFGAMLLHPEDRVPSGDPYSGCYEKYASASALVRRARETDGTLTDGRGIFARREEPQIRQVIDQWIREIVYGLASIIHMLNPSCIILGGGVMEQPFLLEEIRARLKEQIMPGFSHVRIKKALLGNRAGMLGAYARAKEG